MVSYIQSFYFWGFMKRVRLSWYVRLAVTVGETFVGCQWKKTVSIICWSGIIFRAFSKVPSVYD